MPSDDGSVTLTIGAGDTAANASFQVTRHVNDPAFPPGSGSFTFAGKQVEIQAFDPSSGAPISGFTFTNPVQLCFTYNSADIPGVDPSALKIKQYDAATSTWGDLTGITVNTSTAKVCGFTTHLSYFALAAPAMPTPVSGGGGGGGGGWTPPTTTRTRTPTATATPTATPTPTTTPTGTATPAHGTVILSKGWNLISAAYYLKDPSVEAVLGNVADKVLHLDAETGAWEYATKFGSEWSGSLKELEVGYGYWVNSLIDGPLTYSYEPKARPAPVQELGAGWNMIGYINPDLAPSTNLGAYLASISGKWDSLYRYNPAMGFEVAKPAFGFTTMDYGRGYLISMSEAGTLTP